MRMLGHIAVDFSVAVVCFAAGIGGASGFIIGIVYLAFWLGRTYGAFGVMALVVLIIASLLATGFTVDQYRKRKSGEIID